MRRHTVLFSDDKGSILLLSLIILVALSILGGIALKTTNHELTLARNDKVIQRLTTRTESSSAVAIEKLKTTPTPDIQRNFNMDGQAFPWMKRVEVPHGSDDDNLTTMLNEVKATSHWIEGTNSATLSATGGEESGFFNNEFANCQYRVFDVEVAQGSSLSMGNTYSKTGNMKTTLHNFASAGLCQEQSARRMILVGYKLDY